MSQTDTEEKTLEDNAQWPDLAISLYDRLTGRNAEIIYEFEDLEVQVPSEIGDDAEHTPWRLDGTVSITTGERD